MQLMTGVVPRLQALSREGEYGRTKINQYTRYLSVPMALIQAYGYLALLSSRDLAGGSAPVIANFDLFSLLTITQIVTLTAGTVFTMWLGELITERGIGNGISFLIFAVAAVVFMQEGQRRIPIQYASRVRGRRMYQGGSTFLPLRVNQAGVIPIIFAVSILLFPVQLATYFSQSNVQIVKDVSNAIINLLGNHGWLYAVFYFLLTVGFTYFYTAFTFKPDETADQLRKNGGFIPGIRPGGPTRDYLARVVVRISLAGALFLGTIAVLPTVIANLASGSVLAGLGLGGTALLIVVSVVVETMKQLEAQLMMRNYEGFIR